MQWYALDTAAAMQHPLFDFSRDPDAANRTELRLAASDNFFWYTMYGNLGVVGYSGAYVYSTIQDKFTEACEYFVEGNASLVLLAGAECLSSTMTVRVLIHPRTTHCDRALEHSCRWMYTRDGGSTCVRLDARTEGMCTSGGQDSLRNGTHTLQSSEPGRLRLPSCRTGRRWMWKLRCVRAHCLGGRI
jgi:hypothetical protein